MRSQLHSSVHHVLRALLTALLPIGVAARLGAQEPSQQGGLPRVGPTSATRSTHNPRSLRAVQFLDRRAPGTEARVRFEWDQVSGAREYALLGRWTKSPSWTMQTREFRVARHNAKSWDATRVTFDVDLPEGSHSWKVVALFGPRKTGDFASPTLFSFDVR